MNSPFVVLGIEPTADESIIRSAWRRRAKDVHPDVGGSGEEMSLLNAALDSALSLAQEHSSHVTQGGESNGVPLQSRQTSLPKSRRVQYDISSFTVDVLPVESFELLRIAGATMGTICDEECPYLIEFTLENIALDSPYSAPSSAWCRCELAPEAGGTMVHLTVGSGKTALPIEYVRDSLIECINSLES